MDKQTQAAIELARKNLMDFCIVTDPRYTPNWHHIRIAKELELVEQGKNDRLMLFLPPRHGKSELASVKFPAWYLGRNPDSEIITASYSSDLSIDFSKKVRNLVDSSEYCEIFNTRLAKDSRASDRWNTSGQGSFVASGVGGSITGRGANILIIDDPIKNRLEASSDTIRNKIYDWYTSTAFTRLEKGGAVIIIMTRWHDDDLAGRLLEIAKKTGEKWRVVNFPAIATEDEQYRKIGEPLWKDKYDLGALERIRQSIGPRDWTSLYMQEPIDAGTATFTQEMFRYYKTEELDAHLALKDLKIITAIDPALATKQSECYSSLVTIGVDKYYNMFVLDTIFGHFAPDKILNLMFDQAKKWQDKAKTYKVVIEDIQFQKMLILEGRKQQILRKHRFALSGIRPRGDKMARIKSTLQVHYTTGRIYHKESQLELENELVRFPVGKIDVVDSLALAVQASEIGYVGGGGSYDPSHGSLDSELKSLFKPKHDSYLPDSNYSINNNMYV